MVSTSGIGKKCVGVFVAFGCSFLVLYQLIVPAPKEIEFYSVDTRNWQCQDGSRILRTADSELCLGNRNIFFIESSGSEALNARQTCAVESAARYHPNSDVLLLMTPEVAIDLNSTLMKVLRNLVNVRVIKVDVTHLVYGTPLYEWYKSNIWKNSRYKVVHISDALRLFLLWMYGGMYLDLDVVVLRSLAALHNCLVSDNGVNAGSSVLFFDKGHPLLQICIADFIQHYDPDQFAANGPPLIHRNIQRYCNVRDVMLAARADCDVEVRPMEKAYPIPFERWEDYFRPTSSISLGNTFNSSYLIHAWNWLSKSRRIEIGGNSLYELAMKEHCPKVYEHSLKFKHV